jgi:dolichol-phosphate mannosyltransferase
MNEVIAVVIPCYRVQQHILDVLSRIGSECGSIYVIDDACPESTGAYVQQHVTDPRVTVLFNPENLGVGGAVLRGYRQAIDDGADIIVKIDGDGQLDPALIGDFIAPIQKGWADYTKGNRFYAIESLKPMPWQRLMGNAVLSFFTKFSSGYWDIFDPTNGYTAIHARVARLLPFKKISRGYFFESDMLFRLGSIRAVVLDIPMQAVYEDEASNLRIFKVIPEFVVKHCANLIKRIVYGYLLRDMSLASFELLVGLGLTLFGVVFGASHWLKSIQTGQFASMGTIMLAAIALILGIQFLLSFIGYDIAAVPKAPLHKRLSTSLHDIYKS